MNSGTVAHHWCRSLSNQELHDFLKRHYMLEEFGITIVLLPESEEDRRVKESLKNAARRIDDRFETGLLWKENNTELSDSYPMAIKMFRCLEKRRRMDTELYAKVRPMIVDSLVIAFDTAQLEVAEGPGLLGRR